MKQSDCKQQRHQDEIQCSCGLTWGIGEDDPHVGQAVRAKGYYQGRVMSDIAEDIHEAGWQEENEDDALIAQHDKSMRQVRSLFD